MEGRIFNSMIAARIVVGVGLLAGNWAWAGMSVEKIVFQGRGKVRSNIQLVVTGSRNVGYAAQLWKGDYLWGTCRQEKGTPRGKLAFDCGRRKVSLAWDTQQYRNDGIVRALLSSAGESVEPLETITSAL